jgi:hypothetical protein
MIFRISVFPVLMTRFGFQLLYCFKIAVPAGHAFQAECFEQKRIQDLPISKQQGVLEDGIPLDLLAAALAFRHSCFAIIIITREERFQEATHWKVLT